MTGAQITHGDASDAADYFHTSENITHADLVAGMANALRRVATLETELARVRAEVDRLKNPYRGAKS